MFCSIWLILCPLLYASLFVSWNSRIVESLSMILLFWKWMLLMMGLMAFCPRRVEEAKRERVLGLPEVELVMAVGCLLDCLSVGLVAYRRWRRLEGLRQRAAFDVEAPRLWIMGEKMPGAVRAVAQKRSVSWAEVNLNLPAISGISNVGKFKSSPGSGLAVDTGDSNLLCSAGDGKVSILLSEFLAAPRPPDPLGDLGDLSLCLRFLTRLSRSRAGFWLNSFKDQRHLKLATDCRALGQASPLSPELLGDVNLMHCFNNSHFLSNTNLSIYLRFLI